jgi:hypothetical protein
MLVLTLGLAVCPVFASIPSPILAREPVEPQATDSEFKVQMKRLEPANTVLVRLEALKWLKGHCGAKNAAQAIPMVEQCIRADPEAIVRNAAVEGLASLARKRQEPCPLAIIEAMLDKDEMVSQTADLNAGHFKRFAPGCVEVLLRCARSANANLRGSSLLHLAHAGGKDGRGLEAIEKAKDDKSFGVRHNAHCALFQANNNLQEFLTYLIRLQEDPAGVLGPVDTKSEDGKRELTVRNLAVLGSAAIVIEWSEDRAPDLAAALMKLLADPSPKIRRGAARLIGASAAKVELADIDWKTLLEPLADADKWKKLLEPLADADKSQKPLQRSKAAVQFEKLKIAARLRELRDNDPDQRVRQAARTALERLAAVLEKAPS